MTSRSDASAQFTTQAKATARRAAMPPIRRDGRSGRFYELPDGTKLPSVTHVLQVINKPALVNWAANQERLMVVETAADLQDALQATQTPMPRSAYITTLQKRIGTQRAHQRQLAKASEIGTQVHKLIEWNLRRAIGQVPGPEPRVVDEAQWAFMAWEDWARSVDLTPILIEQTVYSRTHGYAGTMDLYASVEGREQLIDFKTGKAIYAEAHLQNAAYQTALREMGHGEPTGGLIVRLPKNQTDPEFEVGTVPPVDELMPSFLAARRLWAWWHAQEEAYRARRANQGAA